MNNEVIRNYQNKQLLFGLFKCKVRACDFQKDWDWLQNWSRSLRCQCSCKVPVLYLVLI